MPGLDICGNEAAQLRADRPAHARRPDRLDGDAQVIAERGVGIVLDHWRLAKLVEHLLDHPIVEMQWGEARVAEDLQAELMQRLFIGAERGGLLAVIAKLVLRRRDARDLFWCWRALKPGAFAGGQCGGEVGLSAAVFLYA